MNNSEKVVPSHLGLILDGNRRWAKARGLPPFEGHRQGYETLKVIADECLDNGVKYLSVYAFSTENWGRSKQEVSFLMKLIKKLLKQHVVELHKKGVRFIWLGCEYRLDEKLVKLLRDTEEMTKNNKVATFALCFNYGGHQEISDTVNRLVAAGVEINPETIEQNLYGGCDLPNVDFLIRTSGEHRISNFMLWRAAYSELYFTNVLWPDFSKKDLNQALAEYASRQRRFGK